jgi:hypothetical protein
MRSERKASSQLQDSILIESVQASPQYPIAAEVQYHHLNYDLQESLSTKKTKTQITVSDLMTQHKDSQLFVEATQLGSNGSQPQILYDMANKYMGHNKPF